MTDPVARVPTEVEVEVAEIRSEISERIDAQASTSRRFKVLLGAAVLVVVVGKLAGVGPDSSLVSVFDWLVRFTFGGAVALGMRRLDLNLKVATLERRLSEAGVDSPSTDQA